MVIPTNTAVRQVGSQKETEHKHTYKTWKESCLHVKNYKHVSNTQLWKQRQ